MRFGSSVVRSPVSKKFRRGGEWRQGKLEQSPSCLVEVAGPAGSLTRLSKCSDSSHTHPPFFFGPVRAIAKARTLHVIIIISKKCADWADTSPCSEKEAARIVSSQSIWLVTRRPATTT